MGNCVAGCKVFGNVNSRELEFYHHKDCPNYPESMSEVMDNLKSKLRKSQEKNESLKTPTNKAMFQLLCDIFDTYDESGCIEIEFDTPLWHRLNNAVLAQQKQ